MIAVLEHVLDHLAAAVERRHGGEQIVFAVEHADAGRPVELVAGEDVEIAIEIAHVDVEMHGALRAVDQHRNAARMRELDDLLHRHRGAERVRHLRDGDHLGARAEQLLEFVDEEVAFVVDRRPFDHRALALAQEMPGHDVGMVLHDREHDLVARLDALATERVGDQIDRLGGVAGEDDLFRPGGVEEALHGLARAFVGLGRLVRQIMQAAMHVGVLLGIGLAGCGRAPACGFCAEAALSR